MTRKSEHYHGKVRWPCGSLPCGPGFHEWQARAQNVLRMTFQGLQLDSVVVVLCCLLLATARFQPLGFRATRRGSCLFCKCRCCFSRCYNWRLEFGCLLFASITIIVKQQVILNVIPIYTIQRTQVKPISDSTSTHLSIRRSPADSMGC